MLLSVFATSLTVIDKSNLLHSYRLCTLFRMNSVLIFLPETLPDESSGYLVGFYKEDKKYQSKAIYILTTCQSEKTLLQPHSSIVGTFSSNTAQILETSTQPVWLHITCNHREITVQNCFILKESVHSKNIIVVLYDNSSFYKSELLLHHQNLFEIDHFRTLAKNLQAKQYNKNECSLKLPVLFINFCLFIFTHICDILSRYSYIVKYSTLTMHFKNYSHSIVWLARTYLRDKSVNIKLGNYIVAAVLDILAGLLVYYTVTSWKNSDEIFNTLSYWAENVIDSMIHLVKWLMGSPAGLKLNQPLASLLGSLVFYYLEIWRNFLGLVRPLLELYFSVLVKLGFLGLTFQLAMSADIFAVMSFHVYCIYVYAARLYEIQAKGIYSLSRLVLGRKRNPEPGKIDSCPYSTEELLIGTISFAVLLFLLPTTLVYYIVFTGMRLGVMLIRGCMTRTMYFMQTLPIYSTLLWIFFPSYTATTVKLTPICTTDSPHSCLLAKLTNSSWFETIKHSIPDALPPPEPLTFGETLSKIVLGKLI